MTLQTRRRLLGVLLLAGIVSTLGCNPITSLYFMAMGVDSKVGPKCKLAKEDDKDEKGVKVVVLTYCGLETRQELLGADRELASLFGARLTEGTKANKEKVTVISPSRVQRYKDEHPNWQSDGVETIGKYFKADYVIDLEIGRLTLFEPRSANQMFRGNAEVSVTVHDMSKAHEEPVFHEEYTTEYPPSRPVPVTDSTPQKFRLMFLTRVATDLSWYFTAHEVRDHFPVD